MSEITLPTKAPGLDNVAVIGCGVIGRSWATVFARAGAKVRVYDARSDAAATVPDKVFDAVEALGYGEETAREVAHRISPVQSLEEALDGAGYAQESVAEDVALKRRLYEEMDKVAPASCILASSCSSIPPAEFLGGLAGERRALIAHPFNPPHLIPLVELVPAPRTADAILDDAGALIRAVGMVPVNVRKPFPGFIGNRLQAAVINEAMHLVAEGVASPEDIDVTLSIGLGRRWALMGPFETMDLNADQGIAEYMNKFGGAYAAMGKELCVTGGWSDEAIGKVISARRNNVAVEDLGARRSWRDRALAMLNSLIEKEVTRS